MFQVIVDVLSSDLIYNILEALLIFNVILVYVTYIDMQINDRIFIIKLIFKKRQFDWKKMNQKFNILLILMIVTTFFIPFLLMIFYDIRALMSVVVIGYFASIILYSLYIVKSSTVL